MELKFRLPKHLPETIYYFRHGEAVNHFTLHNQTTPLNARGHVQAAVLSEYIQQEGILSDVKDIYVSTIKRAQETLECVLENSDRVAFVDPRIDEWWKGVYHSMSKEDIEKYYPAEKNMLENQGLYYYRPLYGESKKDVQIRLLDFLGSLNTDPILISGHGRAGRTLKDILLGESWTPSELAPEIKNCELLKFERKGEYYDCKSLFHPKYDYIKIM